MGWSQLYDDTSKWTGISSGLYYFYLVWDWQSQCINNNNSNNSNFPNILPRKKNLLENLENFPYNIQYELILVVNYQVLSSISGSTSKFVFH